MQIMNKVWVITGRTESGDDIGPYVLDYEPTRLEMHEIVRADMPEEYMEYDETGEIYIELTPEKYGLSYAYPEVNETYIRSKND